MDRVRHSALNRIGVGIVAIMAGLGAVHAAGLDDSGWRWLVLVVAGFAGAAATDNGGWRGQ